MLPTQDEFKQTMEAFNETTEILEKVRDRFSAKSALSNYNLCEYSEVLMALVLQATLGAGRAIREHCAGKIPLFKDYEPVCVTDIVGNYLREFIDLYEKKPTELSCIAPDLQLLDMMLDGNSEVVEQLSLVAVDVITGRFLKNLKPPRLDLEKSYDALTFDEKYIVLKHLVGSGTTVTSKLIATHIGGLVELWQGTGFTEQDYFQDYVNEIEKISQEVQEEKSRRKGMLSRVLGEKEIFQMGATPEANRELTIGLGLGDGTTESKTLISLLTLYTDCMLALVDTKYPIQATRVTDYFMNIVVPEEWRKR